MNEPVKLDWKFAVALSAPVGVGILCWKLTPDQAAAVANSAIDAVKELAVAIKGNR